MSTTYTPSIGLREVGLGDTGWNVPLNSNCDTLDALSPIAGLAVTLKENPSASLNVKVAAGNVIAQDGTITSYGGTTSQAITASSTAYLYLNGPTSWALSVGTTFPTTAHVRLAAVSSGTTTISSITDARIATNVSGTVLDGTSWSVGLTGGLKIGTATTQKIGFYNATPVAQSTGGSAVAGSSYSTVTQGMMDRMYVALRAVGILS